MRTIYNLTDRNPMWRKPALRPKRLRIGTRFVDPGNHTQVPDDFPLRTVAGLLVNDAISIDSIPEWYQAMRRAEEDAVAEAAMIAKKAVKTAEEPPQEDVKPKKRSRKK